MGPYFLRPTARTTLSDTDRAAQTPEDDAYAEVIAWATDGIVDSLASGGYPERIDAIAAVLKSQMHVSAAADIPNVLADIMKSTLNRISSAES